MSSYSNNPLIHSDRRRSRSPSPWVQSFAVTLRPLIVCRGPIRKEAIDTFREMGMTHIGMLLSDKDSIIYTQALAPELRQMPHEHVHRVRDYTGATKDERRARIAQIIEIAQTNGYDSIFAGYGFMAEDDSFVRAIEAAGLTFIGPCSYTVKAAGLKDEAKRTALEEAVSVTPGVNDLTVRALLGKYPDPEALKRCVDEFGLEVPVVMFTEDRPAEEVADAVLNASYAKGIDLLTIDELGSRLQHEVATLFEQFPHNRIRLKAIGGGGGKGQRILARPADDDRPLSQRAEEAARIAAEKLREILAEVNAGGRGDNKNVLIELNIEQTRHNEIQLLGNGEWCVALGGRDCSLQMHEQKLLEISVTREGIVAEIEAARSQGHDARVAALEMEMATLARMESEGERFGQAVKLDSVSTFECIVERDRHYFMEVNTRIQVEHRVTELCYALKFSDPSNPADGFEVTSLVEAMALLAQHKHRLPRPERVMREAAALEARLNATDASLSPHAGGVINYWSDPLDYEIRDDQGISAHNPDTDRFVRYKVAGAYDSNIALLVTHGGDRWASLNRLAEILRATRLRGVDLETNLDFHYGLAHWFIHRDVWAKATTRFVSAYLAQVGLLKEEANQLDLTSAWAAISKHQLAKAGGLSEAMADILARKQTLVLRPVQRFLTSPHLLSGWLSQFRKSWSFDGQRLDWTRNPIELLDETYHFLNMDRQPGEPPAQVIWDHDAQLLETGLNFYQRLSKKLGIDDFVELRGRLEVEAAPAGFDDPLWARVRGAHQGHQAGLELLAVLPLIGHRTDFEALRVREDLTIEIPERLLDPKLQARLKKVLVPPPVTRSDEIVAVSGGMFYSQEAPDRPKLVDVGTHFEAGQALYIIEVMKMFNRVPAPFAGTIEQILVEGGDGTIVKKGQPLFKVRPDEPVFAEDPAERATRQKSHTEAYLQSIL